MRPKFFFLTLIFLLTSTLTLAQTQVQQEKGSIYAIVKDVQGERMEGYLRLYPEEITVSSKDNEEKSVPLKYIESIKLEKIQGGVPGAEQPGGEMYYSVRLQNSQEIYTLRNKYTFSLGTSVGVVTKTIDPGAVQDLFRKDSSSTVRDKGVVFSLEIKF